MERTLASLLSSKNPVGRPKGSTKASALKLAPTKDSLHKNGRPFGTAESPALTTGDSLTQETVDELSEQMQSLASKTPKGWRLSDIQRRKESEKQYRKRYVAHRFVTLQREANDLNDRLELLKQSLLESKNQMKQCIKEWQILCNPEHMDTQTQRYLAYMLSTDPVMETPKKAKRV